MMYLGAIAAVMQAQGLRAIEFSVFAFQFSLAGSVLIPLLLFGILIVYITNGSVRGRSAALGVMLNSTLMISFQALLFILPKVSDIQFKFLQTYSLRIIAAAMIALGIDIFVLFLSYQSLSNLRHRYPSRFASGLALLIALFVDAVIFSILAFGNSGEWATIFQSKIIERLAAGLVLWPLLAIYIFRVIPQLPDSAATSPRPVFDIFITNLQLESRARYHYNLLRTLSHINQLIVRSTNSSLLLEQTCQALIDLRKYRLVWIGTLDEQTNALNFAAQAGFSQSQMEKHGINHEMIKFHRGGISKQAVIINDIKIHEKQEISWYQMMAASACGGASSFPMRHGEKILGVLNIGTSQPNSLETVEIELLQELADDLAYALVSLEARGQQAVLQTAAETMQDGLLIADLEGEIIYANSVLANIIGVETSWIKGKNIDDLFSPQQLPLLADNSKKLFQDESVMFDLPYQTLDGRVAEISINAALVFDHQGQPSQLVANVRDISYLREYQRQLLSLNTLTGELVQIHDDQKLLKRILEIGKDLLESDASGIYLYDSRIKKITNALTLDLSTEYSQRIAKDFRGLPGETVLQTHQAVFVTDTLNDSVFGERLHFMAENKIRALLVLPILFQKQIIGGLTVYYHQPHEFTESQLQLGTMLAQTLAIIIQNAKLHQAESEQRQLAEALVQAAALLNSSLDLETVLDQILEQVVKVFPSSAANISMIEGEQVSILRHRGYDQFPGYIENFLETKFHISTPNFQKMLVEEKALIIPDITQDPDWIIVAEGKNLTSYAGAPLQVDGKIVGFLNVDTNILDLFNDETTHWLQIFTDYAATAIKNARLYTAEHEQRELAEALATATTSVSSTLELDEVLDLILEQTMRVVPCQAVNIMTIENEEIRITKHRGYEAYLPEKNELNTLQPHTTWPLIEEMYAHEKPVLITDTASDPRWITMPSTKWIRSYIGVPLKVEQQIVGFLNIDSDKPNYLTEQYFRRAQTFADYASTAIKNARDYENSRQRAEEMAALVAAASAVSKNLDFMEVIQIVAEQMTKTLQVQACMIAAYNPEEDSISSIVELHPEDWEINPRWLHIEPLSDYPATQNVIKTNTPLQLRAEDPDLSPLLKTFFEETHTKTLLMLPLTTQDQTIGLVMLLDAIKTRKFSVRELTLGLTLASHAATALENARLYRQLQEYTAALEERVQQRTHALQEATEYIEGLLASVPDAVFVLDQKNQFVRVNHAGEILMTQAQNIGIDLFNPELLKILEGSSGPDLQSILEIQERAYQAHSSQLLSDEGEPNGQIIVFRDVTHFRELDQMKTQFVSDVSHELRTPLTNLTLYLGLLSSVKDSVKQNEYLLTLQRETERLTHLIEDLLTISRLEANRIHFQIRATNLNRLIEQLVCDRTILAAQKEIKLHFEPNRHLPLASVDENMLTQAVSNLLTNATNYTLPGGTISVNLAQPDDHWLTIKITDTGVGISPDEAEQVFDRFYRGSSSQQTGAEGTGLGLSISQEIIHRLNGKITLETTPGEGSTFTIWLKPAPV